MAGSEIITIEGKKIKISNPEKLLWPEIGIRKIDYLARMIALAPYALPHAEKKLLTAIRYPDGIHGKRFFQKNKPAYTPQWVHTHNWNGITYVVMDSLPTLCWLVNQAVLEFHTSFNEYTQDNYPAAIVFDLDPSEGQGFEDVVEVALLVKETLDSLSIQSLIKTSGATGLQIYIPVGSRYDYDAARSINEFFGRYFSQKYPKKITIERMVDKRGGKLYFDYLQMWQGKTITMVYSPRTTEKATISMPVEWHEVEKGIKPEDFTLNNALERLKKRGDLFSPLLLDARQESLDDLLAQINPDFKSVHRSHGIT
jgi:bifunctional non-homologous end joining protein LigD